VNLVGRAHARFESGLKSARPIFFSIGTPAIVSAKVSRLLRLSIGCVALSALAACEGSAASQTTDTPSANGTSSKAVVASAAVQTNVAPSIALSAWPPTAEKGGVSSLQWTSTNATACTASGGWKGALATSGTWSTGALSNITEFGLTCTGPGGSATQTATVTIAGSAPIVMLTAEPSTVPSGGASTLKWTSDNVAACSASGAWSGTKDKGGTQPTGRLTANKTYTLTCTGARGSVSQSVTVSIESTAPSVSLEATPSTVAKGASSTLKWVSANATSCSASGAWAGNKPVSGSATTGTVSADATYTMTCEGPGGKATQSATVSVKAPAPALSLSVGPSAITKGGTATLNWSTANATACSASGAWSGSKAPHGSQWTGALTSNATYSLTCTGPGGSATQSATVSVSTHPTVTVSFYANMSTVASGAASKLTWSSSNATSCTASGGWSGSKGVSGSQATAALTADTTFALTCTGTDGSATQSTTVSVISAAPTVHLTASPNTVVSGNGSTLSWSSTNATACLASGDWSGSKATTGSQATGALTANTTYELTCTGHGGTAQQSTTVSVTQHTPTVTFVASPSTVTSGSGSTLTWAATNATSCAVSGAWSGAWSGTKGTSGSQATGALTANQTYGIMCTGAGGSATQSATVSVIKAAPAVTLSASPSTVKSGASTTLTWNSTNATSCTASGGWSGNESTSGSKTTTALTATTSYMLTCTGTGGPASQSVTVTVPTTPTVSLSAGPSSVVRGGSSTLTWVSTNATSCSAAGGWTGSLATSGSKATGAVNATTTYTISCTGAGGTTTQGATVTVAPSTGGGTATVTWEAPTINTDGTTLTSLSGYTIYYGTSQSDLTQSVVVSGPSTLSYEITGLASGTWYFAVAADAADGTQSAMSSIGSKTL
jgi:trimeric autotransporter adhesin